MEICEPSQTESEESFVPYLSQVDEEESELENNSRFDGHYNYESFNRHIIEMQSRLVPEKRK